MNTTLTPPPLPPQAPPPSPPTPPASGPAPTPTGSSGAAKVVSILTIALGGVLLVGAAGSAVLSTVAAASVRTSSQAVAVGEAAILDADVAAGSLRVEFADVSQAELDVTRPWGWGEWTLETRGDTLVVASPEIDFAGGWWTGGAGDAVLRLPESFAGSDVDLTLSAGSIEVDGDFREVALGVSAGEARVSGSADALEVEVSAGGAVLDLADVRVADLQVSAGSIEGELTGDQPDALVLDVSAGSLRLTVPDGRYDVDAEVSAGDFDSRLDESPGAQSTVEASLSAGEIVLRSR
ncbi:hypothetical protein [Microbacterium hominis]|uniref:Adhesin domain-containing protein n=1 Tax=Microbacterium hominis TaxID=162426 RepID=A0A7D4TPV0_9MICO|nr:hypothetical protein [Microbacterium hominis]QKJ20682.1 hypothetical protein HQM25_15870 [Microbacterium hominis]